MKLIDKSALVAEIERRKKYYENIQMIKPVYESNIEDFKELLSFIDILGLKEVNFETELKQWWNNHYSKSYPFDAYAGHYLENSTVIEIAKHFFELGLKVSQKGEDVDAQIKSQNEAIKQLNSALNSMEHSGHLPLVEDNMISDKYIYGKEPEIVDIDDLPLNACKIQYASIDGAIKAHAEDYSFNIESKLFQQLTPEQQKMWRKEIEQAVLSGAYSGLNLARDERYEENKQKMPVSEDLEEAANKYEHSRVYESELENYSIYLENLEEGETPRIKEPSPDTKYLLNADIIEAFKAGSQWHKRQMMKDTVNVIVKSHPYFGLLIQVPDSFKCELGDEISIILNK